MGFLGKKSGAGTNTSIIGELPQGLPQTTSKKQSTTQNVINQILDRDNDGNIMDDLGNLGMSILGKMLKKR